MIFSLQYLMEFNSSPGDLMELSPLFSDDSRVAEAASIAQKLRKIWRSINCPFPLAEHIVLHHQNDAKFKLFNFLYHDPGLSCFLDGVIVSDTLFLKPWTIIRFPLHFDPYSFCPRLHPNHLGWAVWIQCQCFLCPWLYTWSLHIFLIAFIPRTKSFHIKWFFSAMI